MLSIDQKLTVLVKFADRLNVAEIKWAIGASLLLYFKAIVDNFNDIDVLVEVDDVDKLQAIFKELGAEKILVSDNSGFKTTNFIKYNLDGVQIDVMAGFKIEDENKVYDCSFKKSDIYEYYNLNGCKIPLDKLENWKRYYNLLKRPNKVELIKEYLEQNKAS